MRAYICTVRRKSQYGYFYIIARTMGSDLLIAVVYVVVVADGEWIRKFQVKCDRKP